MGNSVMKLGLILSATDKLSRVVDQAVGKSIDKLTKFEKKANAIGKGMQKAGAGMMAAGGVITGALFADVQNIAEKAKQIQFSSQKIGLSTTEFQKLGYAASKSGMEISQFETGIGRLSKMMVGASLGQKASIKIMNYAGISANDASGKLKSTTEILKELSNKFQSAPDGPKKTALAMMLFGKSGKDMIPLLNKGGTAIDELGAKFAKSGALLDKEAIEKFKKYRGSIADTKLAMQGFKTQIAISVLPTMIKYVTKIAQVAEKISGWIDRNKTLFNIIVGVTGTIGMLLTGMGAFVLATGTVIRFVGTWGRIINLARNSMVLFKLQYYGLVAAQKLTAAWTAITTSSVWAFTAALLANPITWIVVGIAALVAGLIYAWKHFATFRAVILTTWETIKGFGTILKDYVLDRIKGIITGLGSVGKAIGLLFKGKFKEAFKEAQTGVKALSGYDAKMKAVTRTKDLATKISGNYTTILKREQTAQSANEKPRSTAAIQANNTSIASRTSSNSNAINYNPVIHINSGSAADKESFRKMLADHKGDLAQMMMEIQNKKQRLSFT